MQSAVNECEELFSLTEEGGFVYSLFICIDARYTDKGCREKEVFPLPKFEQVRCASNLKNNIVFLALTNKEKILLI